MLQIWSRNTLKFRGNETLELHLVAGGPGGSARKGVREASFGLAHHSEVDMPSSENNSVNCGVKTGPGAQHWWAQIDYGTELVFLSQIMY